MRLLAGLLVLATVAGCADLNRLFPLERYDPTERRNGR